MTNASISAAMALPPMPAREKTIIGLDYDGTITRDSDMWHAVMTLMQSYGHEVHIVTMRHGIESTMGGAPMERRFLEDANGVHFTGNLATGDRDAKRPHMEAKGIGVHVWIDDNPKAVHMSAREIWGFCTQPGDAMLHSAPEVDRATPAASPAPMDGGFHDAYTDGFDDGKAAASPVPADERASNPSIAECITQLDVWNGHLEAAIDREAHEQLGQHANDEPAAGGRDPMEQFP